MKKSTLPPFEKKLQQMQLFLRNNRRITAAASVCTLLLVLLLLSGHYNLATRTLVTETNEWVLSDDYIAWLKTQINDVTVETLREGTINGSLSTYIESNDIAGITNLIIGELDERLEEENPTFLEENPHITEYLNTYIETSFSEAITHLSKTEIQYLSEETYTYIAEYITADLEDTLGRITSLEDMTASLSNRATSLEDSSNLLSTKTTSLEEASDTLALRADSLEESSNTLALRADTLEEEQNSLSSGLMDTNAEIAAIKEELQNLHAEISNIDRYYPINSLYLSFSDTNPSQLFGGTWEQIACGATLVGAGTGVDSSGVSKAFALGETGGTYNHLLTVAELPSHSHSLTTLNSLNVAYVGSIDNTFAGGSLAVYQVSGNAATLQTSNAGGNTAFSLQTPYLTVYIWKRIS